MLKIFVIFIAVCLGYLPSLRVDLDEKWVRHVGGLIASTLARKCLEDAWKNQKNQFEQAEVGIILGYALFKNDTPTRPLQQRIEAGIQLQQAKKVKYLLFSGGHPHLNVQDYPDLESEASIMTRYALEQLNAEPRNWILEQGSTSTRENAVESLKLCHYRQFKQIVIITNAFHQLRSHLVFCNVAQQYPDMKIFSLSLPPTQHRDFWPGGFLGSIIDNVWSNYDLAREVAAIAWYKWKNWL